MEHVPQCRKTHIHFSSESVVSIVSDPGLVWKDSKFLRGAYAIEIHLN